MTCSIFDGDALLQSTFLVCLLLLYKYVLAANLISFASCSELLLLTVVSHFAFVLVEK